MNVEEEHLTLVTRAREYQKTEETVSSPSTTPKRKSHTLPKRNSVFLKCEQHTNFSISKKKETWSETNTACPSCLKFEVRDEFRPGILTLRSKQTGIVGDKNFIVAKDVKLQWIYCNVYPLSLPAITRRIKTMVTDYDYFTKYTNQQKKKTYWEKYSKFVETQNSLFDILADVESRAAQGRQWGVMITETEIEFLLLAELTKSWHMVEFRGLFRLGVLQGNVVLPWSQHIGKPLS